MILADISAVVGTIATTVGDFLGEEGKLSSDVMRIQDSFYYQDYSYVVKVSESINEWRDAIKSTVHPSGWAVFGEVEVKSLVSARIQVQTVESFTPELASLLTPLIVTVFGRRLGTTDDGTTLRSTPKVGVDSHTDLTTSTRDLTLSRINTVVVGTNRSQRGASYWATLDLLPKYAFAVPPTDTDIAIPHYPKQQELQLTIMIIKHTLILDSLVMFVLNKFRIVMEIYHKMHLQQNQMYHLERLLLQQVVLEVSIRLVTHLLDLIIQLIHLMKMLVVEIQEQVLVQY